MFHALNWKKRYLHEFHNIIINTRLKISWIGISLTQLRLTAKKIWLHTRPGRQKINIKQGKSLKINHSVLCYHIHDWIFYMKNHNASLWRARIIIKSFLFGHGCAGFCTISTSDIIELNIYDLIGGKSVT